MALVNQIAADVSADETALRSLIVRLIDEARFEDAKSILRAWDSKAAGDVLREQSENCE